MVVSFPPDSVPCSARVEGNSLNGGKEMTEGCRIKSRVTPPDSIQTRTTKYGIIIKEGGNRLVAVCDDWISVVC